LRRAPLVRAQQRRARLLYAALVLVLNVCEWLLQIGCVPREHGLRCSITIGPLWPAIAQPVLVRAPRRGSSTPVPFSEPLVPVHAAAQPDPLFPARTFSAI